MKRLADLQLEFSVDLNFKDAKNWTSVYNIWKSCSRKPKQKTNIMQNNIHCVSKKTGPLLPFAITPTVLVQ